ncbi:MAG: CARDB domain-containing protein, partial [Dokdonella sp.]
YLTATAALAYAHDQRPNLALVGAPTFAPVQPHDGERVTLSAVVSNSGNVAVGETLLRWFDGDPDQGGTQIGMDVIVPSLVSGSRVNTTQTWDTSNRAGEHALWVVLDAGATAAESSEQDNRGQLAVTVLPPSSLPDLSLSAADFSLTPTTVTALPSNVHVAGTLRDIGAQGVSSAVVRVFAKPDLTHALAQAIVDVAARGSVPISLDFNATTAATLNLLLRADPENAVAEASETNNDAELVLPFGQSLDLEVLPTDLAVLTATPLVGHSVAMDVTVHNRGTVDSPPVVLHAEIVQGGATATIFDAPVQLPAGQSVHRQLTWLPDQPGNVQLRISLDPANQVAETREDNNSAQLDFVVSALDQPDLTFVADSLGFLPTPALQGQPLTASVGVRNLSSVASGSFRVALYATDPSTGASPIGSTTVASLAASSETTATMVVPELELSGDQRLFAKIDADNQIAEVDETNNIIVKALRVLSLPDLAISVADIVLTPPLPVPGQAVQARVTVRNLGSQDANGTVVGLFEGDATTGVSVGPDQSLGTLAAGASMTLTWNWTLGLAPNARSVTAIADPGNIVDEGREDNNSASLPFDVQDGDFFASERYISPNGDGVQDAAVVVFRMPQAGPVEVDVVNGAQYAVRHFSDVALNGDLRGQIIWDGRDDRGRIVPDGDYRVVATGADHQGRGNLLVSVDNNLSSMLEAVDTPYGVYGVLPSNMFGTQIPPASSPLRDQLFGFWARVNNGVVGLYRTGTLFPAAVPIISDQWVTAFGLAQQSPHAALAAFAFSPDGSELAVVLAGQTAGGQYKVWVLRTAVDQMNAPTVVASFDNTSPMRVLGYFDANTMVVGPTSDGVLQLVDINSGVVTPYRSYADVPSGGQSTVLPVGILWSDQGQDYRDYPRLFVPRDQGSPIIHLETSAPESGIEYAYAAQLSPRKSAVAIHTRDGQREAVELVDLATGARSTLTQVVPGIAHGARSGEQASVGRYYGMGWLERQDQLLVQDAATRSLLVYAESGQRLSQTPFPELQRIGDYAVDGNQPPEHSDPTNVFPETFNGLTTDRCQGIDAGLGTERQIFDPATNRLFLGFGESVAHDVFEEGSWALESSSGIRDYFSADVDTGVVETIQQGTLLPLIVGADIAQHPLRHTCMDAPPKDWPLLILGDGARILEDGHVQTLSRGVLPKSWLDENNSLQAVWPDETRAQLNGHVFSSLLNLTAELQARTLGRGIELSGVAADRNFAYYKLDWAPIEQPNNWQALTPASPDQVFIDEFLNWVPPQSGTFVIRLTVVDKAGNSTSTSVTASSFDSSAIDNFSLSPRYFSPNGDGVKDQLVVKYRVRQAVTLDVRIKDANGNIVRSVDLTYGIADVGAQEFDWNGRNDSGQLLPDGRYRVDVDGFAGWVIIDTVAPELAGDIVQAYRKAITDDVSPLEVVNVQPEVRHAARDPNLVEVVLESALSGGDVWALLPGTRCCSLELGSSLDPGRNIGDPANWNGLTVPIDAFANHSFRMRATDAAGNIRLLALGNADEALPLSSVSGQKRTFAYQPPPFAQPPDALSLLPLLVEHDAEDYLQAWDVSGLVSRIAVETTPIDTPDQWIERGNYEIADVTCTMVTCGRDFKPGELHVPFDVDALPQGTRALVRLRGAHANGTQLYSNQGYIHVGGIEAPICNGTIEDVVPKISVSAVEFYDGPLASASLHFVSHSGEEELAAASSIGVEKANFILPATSDGSTAWVAGVDTQGYRHVSPVSILLCPAGPPNPPVDRTGWHIALNRKPVIQDQCDGRPSDQIMLDLSIREVAPPTPIEPLPSHIKLSYVDGISGLRVVLLERDVNESNASQATRTFTLSTVHWPEAEYEGRLDMTYPGGGVGSKIIQLPVVKQPPQIAITSPAAGQRVCAVPAELGNQTLQIAGSVDSLGASSYRIEFGLGARPPAFECKARRGEEPPPSLFQQEPECLPYMALTNIVGASTSGSLVNVRGKLETYNGISTVRLKGLNWSGGTVCTDSTIYLDSDIEYLESAPPKTMLPTMGLSIVGIAPMGDPAHMQGQFFLRANEPVQFAATVHRATIDHQSGALKLEEAVLTTLTQADSIEGNIDVVWDGRIGGDVVADGLYGIAATASDGCGHVKTIQYGAVVDSTPPLVALTAPAQGSSSAAAVIEIVGAVTDTALVGWSLDVSLAASPHSWQNLSAGGSPITTPAAIKAWSRGSVTGPVDLRLSAIDAFGNRAETHVSITLEDPPKLIGAAELQPPLFSPNGDGALDTTRLQLSLLQNASIDIRAGNASLYAGPTPAGISGLAWSGLDANGHPVPDGIYQMDIRATDPNGVAVPESLTLTATIDSTPPMVEVQQPNGAFAAASSSVRLRVEDTHLANFDARLTRSVDGVVVASLGGTQGGDVLLSTLADLADGVYALHVEARDGAANVTTRDVNFTIDATPPVVALSAPAEGALIASNAATSVQGSVNDAHLASYTLSVAPEQEDSWTELTHGSANVPQGEVLAWHPNLPDGRYRLRLRGIDEAGNTAEVIRAVDIDGTPPVAHISAPVDGGFLRSSAEIQGTATDAHFAGYRLSVIAASQETSGQWTDVYGGTVPVDAGRLALLTLTLPEDDYLLRLVVTDHAGLSSSDQVHVRIDTQAPPTPINLVGHVDDNRDSVLDWNAVAAPDLAGYSIYRGGERINATPVSAVHYVDAAAPEGGLKYSVRAIDHAGNESASSNVVTLLIDHTPPITAILRPIAGERVRGVYDVVGTAYSNDDFKQYRLSAQALSPAGTVEVVGGSTLALQGRTLALWNTLALAEETTVRLHLEADDVLGNSASADVDVVVDNMAPAAPTGLAAALSGLDAQVHWNPNSESDLLGYLLYRDNVLVNAPGPNLPADLRPFALTDVNFLDANVPDGQHSYVVYAIDRAGNVSPPSAPATLDPIDNLPPSMTMESPLAGARFDTSIVILATSRDTDIAEVGFSYRAQGASTWVDLGAALTNAPYRITWTPAADVPYGAYEIRALARDLGGRYDPQPPVVAVVRADLTPPGAPARLVAHSNGDTVHLAWNASGASDLAGYRIYRDHLQIAVAASDALTSDDLSLPDGDYVYTVTALDAYGNESTPSNDATAPVFSVSLDQPYSPTTASAIDLSGRSGKPGTLSLHVDTDSGSSDSTPSPVAGAAAFVLNAQSLLSGGNHFVARVADASGNVSRSAEVWVDRGAIPVAPTGVAVTIDDHTATLRWDANAEADVIGYRVFRNGGIVAPDALLAEATVATSDAGGDPTLAVDGDPQTYWETTVADGNVD